MGNSWMAIDNEMLVADVASAIRAAVAEALEEAALRCEAYRDSESVRGDTPREGGLDSAVDIIRAGKR